MVSPDTAMSIALQSPSAPTRVLGGRFGNEQSLEPSVVDGLRLTHFAGRNVILNLLGSVDMW